MDCLLFICYDDSFKVKWVYVTHFLVTLVAMSSFLLEHVASVEFIIASWEKYSNGFERAFATFNVHETWNMWT